MIIEVAGNGAFLNSDERLAILREVDAMNPKMVPAALKSSNDIIDEAPDNTINDISVDKSSRKSFILRHGEEIVLRPHRHIRDEDRYWPEVTPRSILRAPVVDLEETQAWRSYIADLENGFFDSPPADGMSYTKGWEFGRFSNSPRISSAQSNS